MSDSEYSDDLEELQELVAEYEAKEQSSKEAKPKSQSNEKSKVKPPASNKSSEVPMDKLVFGDKKGLIKNLQEGVNEKLGQENKVENFDEDSDKETEKRSVQKRKPAWIDADDEEIHVGEIKRATVRTGPIDHLNKDKSYKNYLTNRFTRIVAQPKWATSDRSKKTALDSDEEDDDALLKTVGFLAKPSSSVLLPKELNFKRLKNINRISSSQGRITSIQFHPTSTAALVSGEKGFATIYAIDGNKNEKLHSMFFEKFPIKCAKIKSCGTQAIFGSLYNNFYMYDLLAAQETKYYLPKFVTNLKKFQLSPCNRYMAVAGRFGQLYLLDCNSFELIHTFQQEDPVKGISFTADSNRIICNTDSNEINIFSLRRQRLEHRFIDDGCIRGSALDLSANQRLLATGSEEGIVNVYDFENVLKTKSPLPLKSFKNLTTCISDVKFNHSSEILAMSSEQVQSGIKLAHFPSATVYANFPKFQANLGKIRTVEFSPFSGFLALGTCASEAPLIRIKHFQNY